MNIETTDDLCEQIADWAGVYGCCKQKEYDDNGELSSGCENTDPKCCRVGFVIELKDRMIKAVEMDKKIEKLLS